MGRLAIELHAEFRLALGLKARLLLRQRPRNGLRRGSEELFSQGFGALKSFKKQDQSGKRFMQMVEEAFWERCSFRSSALRAPKR